MTRRPLALLLTSTLVVGGVVASAGARPGVVKNGTAADNFLVGTRGDDKLDGKGGDDRLVGAAGADRLVGGSGYDRMSGGTGNDYIDARDRGPDVVDCGPGRSDRVRYDQADTVRNCESKRR